MKPETKIIISKLAVLPILGGLSIAMSAQTIVGGFIFATVFTIFYMRIEEYFTDADFHALTNHKTTAVDCKTVSSLLKTSKYRRDAWRKADMVGSSLSTIAIASNGKVIQYEPSFNAKVLFGTSVLSLLLSMMTAAHQWYLVTSILVLLTTLSAYPLSLHGLYLLSKVKFIKGLRLMVTVSAVAILFTISHDGGWLNNPVLLTILLILTSHTYPNINFTLVEPRVFLPLQRDEK